MSQPINPSKEYWERLRAINQEINDRRVKLLNDIADRKDQLASGLDCVLPKEFLYNRGKNMDVKDVYIAQPVAGPAISPAPPVTQPSPPAPVVDREQEAWDWMARRVRG